MKYLFIFFLTFTVLAAEAQTSDTAGKKGSVDASVYDNETKEAIPYATIRLLQANDSTFVKGTTTDANGFFKIEAPLGIYSIEISFIGYRTYNEKIEISSKDPNIKLNKIYLNENTVMLNDAVVEAKVPDIVVKGDTIEYNATAYTSQESDMLQDIIKNIPGIEIDSNGNITANGKPVQKILVDGKEFFGNDIAMALANLPANMIKKLQLFKEESETAKITGFKDKNPAQVLNLVVKEELKQSTFGDARLGYGSDSKYSNRVLVNHMRNDNQYSIVGNMNNVNANEEYMADNGIEKNKSIGGNMYTQSSPKFKIGANARYNKNDNYLETNTNTQTFLSTGDRLSKQGSQSNTGRENFSTGLNLSWEPDSMTMIFARSFISFNKTISDMSTSSLSYVANKDTTSGYSSTFNKGDGYNLNNLITIGRKLNSKGRTVSLTLGNTIRKDNAKGTNYSETKYNDGTADKIIDQQLKTDNMNNNYNFSLSYVEPLGKGYSIQLMYSYNNSHSKRIRDTRKKDNDGNYTVIDSAYARNTINDYITQNINLNFQANKEKYSYTIGFSLDPSTSKSNITLGDSIIENVKQKVVNYSPNIHFTYTPNSNTNVDFDYSGSTSQPTISQLSADTTIVNALTKYYGNPNLKPSYSNNFSVYYYKSDYETNRFMMIMGGFNFTINNIVNYTNIDDKGNTINTYRNVDGNMGANMGFMYNTPLRNKKFTISTNSNANYYRNIGFTNGEKAITNNIVLSEQVSLKFKNKIIETELEANISESITKNNLTEMQNKTTGRYGLKNKTVLKLPFDFSIQNNIEYTYYDGYEQDFKNTELLWNASITKLFLKKKVGTLKAQIFDILNDRNTLSRYVSGNYVSDSRNNTINRYFLLSFSYRFNLNKGSKDNAMEETD